MIRTLLPWGAMLLAAAPAWAEPSAAPRDPMRPPQLAPPRAGAASPAGAPATPLAVRQLLLVDGQRYVVDGGRRRAVGELLGDARIERIDDTAVIVRRAGQSQRLALYAGVTKKPSPEPGMSAPAQPASAAPPAVHPSRAARTALAPTLVPKFAPEFAPAPRLDPNPRADRTP